MAAGTRSTVLLLLHAVLLTLQRAGLLVAAAAAATGQAAAASVCCCCLRWSGVVLLLPNQPYTRLVKMVLMCLQVLLGNAGNPLV
jgi:hypothetical protein